LFRSARLLMVVSEELLSQHNLRSNSCVGEDFEQD
jgi:hypothetical protein